MCPWMRDDHEYAVALYERGRDAAAGLEVFVRRRGL